MCSRTCQSFQSANPGLAATSLQQYYKNMNLGFPEMVFLFIVALLIFGPKKLPEIGRQIGRALNEFKRASNEFKAQIESEINQLDLENQRQALLPPAQPPDTIASPSPSEVVRDSDLSPASKAPDA
jgi:TatA/E family protein of Tat protein translocase